MRVEWRGMADALASVAAAWREAGLADAARGRPAWQSSYHGNGARGLRPDGSHPNKGFRMTLAEARPWWMVDLERDLPIHAIRLHNSHAARAHRMSRVTVSVSRDRAQWQAVHAGVHFFGDAAAPGPLDIRLHDRCRARFVRLELPDHGVLCAARVEVLVDRRQTGGSFIAVLRRWLRKPTRRRLAASQDADLVDIADDHAIIHGPARVVDLRTSHPIHQVRIHGDRDSKAPQGVSLLVSLSNDAVAWEPVHAGFHVFGNSAPLALNLRGTICARFLRLACENPAFRRVEVLVTRQALALAAVCQHHGFNLPAMSPARSGRPRYTIDNASDPFGGAVTALHVTRPVGRFGNHLKSILHAVCLARRLGIARIYLPPLAQFPVVEPIEAGGITLLPESSLPGEPGAVLAGPFYHREAFGDALAELPQEDAAWAVGSFARPLFLRTLPRPAIAVADTDLAIHIRSGDLFAQRLPHADYVQPPLAYYQLAIAQARQSLGVDRVILVYEDDRNPTVGALQDWLRQVGVPVVPQSASLAEDLAILMQARQCVFGYGTFGTALVRLSQRMRTVFLPWTMIGLPQAARSAGVRPVVVRDIAGAYIRPGRWRGTPEQLRMMVEYPIDHLTLDADPPAILPPTGGAPNEADG